MLFHTDESIGQLGKINN